VQAAFGCAALDWQQYVAVDPRYYRPAEVDALQADCSKARRVLGWEPTVTFKRLVRMMVDADTADLERALNGGREALRAVGAGVGD
jgi:GDPmannose 4,6-dehydratase